MHVLQRDLHLDPTKRSVLLQGDSELFFLYRVLLESILSKVIQSDGVHELTLVDLFKAAVLVHLS